MYTVFLAGGMASGKSTVAAELERLGACRVDLDQLSREVLAAGSDVTRDVAAAFGQDLVDARTGELDRRLLAARAFASDESRELLERIELPAIGNLLRTRLEELSRGLSATGAAAACEACVVEVPLLDRALDLLDLADEVVCVSCPAEVRLARAVGRGMEPSDAKARLASQPSDEWLEAHADTVIRSDVELGQLVKAVTEWWDARERADWASPRRQGTDAR